MTVKSDTFHKSLKPLAIEEWLDYFFYRRLAHFLIPFFYRLGITPNMVTTFSLVTGLFSAWAAYNSFFVLSALLAIFAIILDCCDGQLARLTGKAGPIGRIMDGLFDFLWITALWIGIYLSGYLQQHDFPNPLLILICTGFTFCIHCWRFDAVKIRYLELADPDFSEKNMDFDEIKAFVKKEGKIGNLFVAFLGVAMMLQMFLAATTRVKKVPTHFSGQDRHLIKTKLEPIINCWSFLGESHHNTLFIVGLFAASISPIMLKISIWLLLVPANAYYFWCEWQWHKAIKKLNPVIQNPVLSV